jgi:hypothetical protein
MVFGLEGFEIGDDEADKNPIKAASDGEQGDGVHYSVNDAFNLVHSFGFSGWGKKSGCLSSLSALYEYCGTFAKFNYPSRRHCSNA